MKESTAWWLFQDRGFVFLVHALEPLLATERKTARRLLCYFACPSLFGEGDGAPQSHVTVPSALALPVQPPSPLAAANSPGTCQPQSLVVRGSDSYRESASREARVFVPVPALVDAALLERHSSNSRRTAAAPVWGGAGLVICYRGSLAVQDVVTLTTVRPPTNEVLVV